MSVDVAQTIAIVFLGIATAANTAAFVLLVLRVRRQDRS